MSFLNRLDGQARHIGEERMHIANKNFFTIDSPTDDIFENLTAMGVIKRKWKLDRCRYCDKSYWTDDINLNEPILCPGCFNSLPLRKSVTVGYELNELIRLSIKEGITPVILTARFLRNLTRAGFFWHPGAKIVSNIDRTDFDLLACCDGHLVAAECKTLTDTDDTSPVWGEILEQLATPISIAKACSFEIFVISILRDDIPHDFKKKAKELAGKRLKIEFLTKADLQSGYRHTVTAEGHQIRVDLFEFMNPGWRNLRPSKKPKLTRSISF